MHEMEYCSKYYNLKYDYIDPELINEFRLPALQFEKTNKYTNFIPGTYSYKKFWDNELERVNEGYKIDDILIIYFCIGIISHCFCIGHIQSVS